MTLRPFARVHQVLRGTRTSSPSDLMALPSQFNSHACFVLLCLILSRCLTIHTACMPTLTISTRRLKKNQGRSFHWIDHTRHHPKTRPTTEVIDMSSTTDPTSTGSANSTTSAPAVSAGKPLFRVHPGQTEVVVEKDVTAAAGGGAEAHIGHVTGAGVAGRRRRQKWFRDVWPGDTGRRTSAWS